MRPRVCPYCLHGGSKQTLSGAEKWSWTMLHQEPAGDEASSMWTQVQIFLLVIMTTFLDYAETLVARHYYAFHLDSY